MIKVEQILELIGEQFDEIMATDSSFYSKYDVIITNEQQFIKKKDLKADAIYMVIKFLPATINFGQTILPITINCVSEQNKIEACQRLLLEYAQTYNLTTNENNDIKQVYTSPSNASNFNEMYVGFRSIFYMSGTFLISENSNQFELYYVTYDENENPVETLVDCISNSFAFSNVTDSQPFFNTNNFAKSVGMYGIFTVNFTTYLTNVEIMNRILDIVSIDLSSEPDGVNADFVFTLKFRNGKRISERTFKLVNFSVEENIGELPIASVSFSN